MAQAWAALHFYAKELVAHADEHGNEDDKDEAANAAAEVADCEQFMWEYVGHLARPLKSAYVNLRLHVSFGGRLSTSSSFDFENPPFAD